LIENYRPGTLEEMGLGPDVLHAGNPDLIVVRISGFGQTGPYAELPGFGTLVEAMSGFAARTGFADREPVLPPLALADMIAGLYGTGATVTALFARTRGLARGQVIDVSLLEAIFSILGPEAAIYRHTGAVKGAVGGWFAQRTREEALRIIRENEVTVGPVYNIDDAVEDAHFRERAIIVEAEDADLGTIPMHNIVPRLSATPGVWRRPAPALGEHTDEILKEAGYDTAGIAALRQCKAAA